MYFKVVGIDSSRIVSVVHDIIPLRDPMMTPYWRGLFLTKLEGVLALNPNFAFVSEYSRDVFEQNFPAIQNPQELRLLPDPCAAR